MEKLPEIVKATDDYGRRYIKEDNGWMVVWPRGEVEGPYASLEAALITIATPPKPQTGPGVFDFLISQ